MEEAIAIKLWKRSVVQNQLVYSTYIGDGDSSSYKRLVESDTYSGLEDIRKEECLGHIQKRVKKHLKKASPTSSAVAKSKVERVGHLYALVVCQNRGKSAAKIQRALYTLLKHLGEDHSNCPCTTDSWCYLARTQAERKLDSSAPLPLLRTNPTSLSQKSRVAQKSLKLLRLSPYVRLWGWAKPRTPTKAYILLFGITAQRESIRAGFTIRLSRLYPSGHYRSTGHSPRLNI